MSIVKLNNNGVKNATAIGSITSLGSMIFIKKLTASSSATLSFVDGASSVVLDNTYPIYKFEFINIHPATDSAIFQVGFRDGGTDYDAPKTSTFFYASHKEDDSQTVLAYETSYDQAQSTSFQNFNNIGNANDENVSGDLQLFNPSSTTFVKHFIARSFSMMLDSGPRDVFAAGYFNTTSAIDEISFKFTSGNIDSGTIKLYGIKDS
jgi:hypothetical protein